MNGLILAVDPGDMTGLAYWDMEGNFLGKEQVTLEELPAAWERIQATHDCYIKTAIVEDYMLFGKRAQSQIGSRMKAPQGIGMVKALAHSYDSEVIVQRSNIKSVALKWSQIKLPSDHSKTHEWDAYLHGYYYLVQHKIIKTSLQLQKEAGK